MNENQYIAFKYEGDSLNAWYFGTSDEFDEAREGYLPGYFVSQINDLTTKEDSIFFSISTGYSQCYFQRFPIGFIDTTKLNKQYEKWSGVYGEDQIIEYSGILDGLKLYVKMAGETRTYLKTRNHFHPGIDNYNSTKCRTEPLQIVNQYLETLSKQMILNFLTTFSVTCESNVEFGELSNELLFKILLAEPDLTLKVISKNLSELDTVSIYQELESPLHDLIPIDSITTKINQLDIDDQIKKSVLNRLKKRK